MPCPPISDIWGGQCNKLKGVNVAIRGAQLAGPLAEQNIPVCHINDVIAKSNRELWGSSD